jgi:hypothetical protein
MSIHPIHSDNYNYTRLAQLFIDHSIVNKDDYIEKNLVELHVYVESSAIQFIEELASYDFGQLTSDLGGVLGIRGNQRSFAPNCSPHHSPHISTAPIIGLYLGMTVVAVVELLEILVMFAYIYVRRNGQTKPTRGASFVDMVSDGKIEFMPAMFLTDGQFAHATNYGIVDWIDRVQQLSDENEQMKRKINAVETKLNALLTGKNK